MHNLYVALADCSCMFWSLRSKRHQAVYHKYKKGIILHVVSERHWGPWWHNG